MTLVWPMFDVGMFVSKVMQTSVALERLQELMDVLPDARAVLVPCLSRPDVAATPARTNENSPVWASPSPVTMPSRSPWRSTPATMAATTPALKSTTAST